MAALAAQTAALPEIKVTDDDIKKIDKVVLETPEEKADDDKEKKAAAKHVLVKQGEEWKLEEPVKALANLGEVLKTAGMGFEHVTTVTAYITNFDEFERFNTVYREYFPKDPPARATVQVAALNAGARVELQMIAVKPGEAAP